MKTSLGLLLMLTLSATTDLKSGSAVRSLPFWCR